MGNFLPSTEDQVRQMLDVLGLDNLEQLYRVVPQGLLRTEGPEIPKGLGELAVLRKMGALAGQNTVFPTMFRGAGAYRHYIPSVVSAIAAKETFVTAYTPYQAELSQGILQAMFEYQTMICQLTGLDVSNASVYDGATAAAEAVSMCRERKRTKALVSAAANPETIETIRTYCWAADCDMAVIPMHDGKTDADALAGMLTEDVACVYIQQPSFYGQIEDAKALGEQIHAGGAKYILGLNPIAAVGLPDAASCLADIAVGEGQPLGLPLSFGGPYLGFMAATNALMRKLPGRMVGETTDDQGNRAFVLTLQAREQHIRREKASSNVCSNQALCATTAAIYMAAMGPQGLGEVFRQCYSKAHYLADELKKIPGFSLRIPGEFFHEFVSECPVDTGELLAKLESHGILGGQPVDDSGILWCVTEMNTKEEMDQLIALLREVSSR